MLYDKYSTHNGLMNYDNNYFDYDDKGFVDFFKDNRNIYDMTKKSSSVQQNMGNTSSVRSNFTLDRFEDGSAPPNENQDEINDPTILLKKLPGDTLYTNQDYKNDPDSTDSKLYDNYDKYYNVARIEPYQGQPGVKGRQNKQTFSNMSDGFSEWISLSWTDILLILNLILSLLD